MDRYDRHGVVASDRRWTVLQGKRLADELYRSDTLLVRSVPAADATRWAVTFDNYGVAGSFDRPGFAQEFLASRGVSQVNVLVAGNDWYQYPDLDAALMHARAAVAGAARVITYGSSMGGYAAIRFARRVGAHACLALSPQYSNDPTTVPFEWRWANDAGRIRWLPEVDGPIVADIVPVVIADARREDAAHVRRIERDITIEKVALGHVGHPIATYLSSVGLLERAVLEVLDGSFDAAAFHAEAAAARRTNGVYLCELARLQPAGRPRTAVAIARRALAVDPDSVLVMHILARKLTEAGEQDEALEYHARVYARSGGFGGYALPYSEALVAAGRQHEARVIARRLAVEHPHAPGLQSWFGHLLWLAGNRDGARLYAAAACRLAPGNEFYAANLAMYDEPLAIPSELAPAPPRGWVRRAVGL